MQIDERTAEKATLETVTALDWRDDSLLTFTVTRPPGYAFTAGQYARLGVQDAHGFVWRAYSMASAPDQDLLEFYGIIVPEGLFTTQLKAMQPGDRILVEKQSFGFMTPDRFPDGDDLWMFATGTGIGPFVSMLRDPSVWEKFRNLILVHCVRHAGEFAYHEQLVQLGRQPPTDARSPARLHLVRSTTREQTPATGPLRLQGRVTTLFDNGELEKAVGLPITEASSRIMLCGNPQMIEDMRRLLHKRGLRPQRRALPGHFVTENYW
ncbi:MAG: ferredoxin--NADP reductase [Noviherbaspirillum sp.]